MSPRALAASWRPRERHIAGLGVRTAAGVAAAVAAGVAAGAAPWAALGVFAGGLLLVILLAQPLVIVGLMLAIGPIDLSFMTGGFKGLLTEQGGLDMNGIRLIGLTLGFAAIALVDMTVVRHALGRHGRWYLVFLVYAAGTLVLSTALVDGLRLLLKIAFPFLVFLVVRGMTRSTRDLTRLVDCALVGAAVIALVLNPLYVMGGGYEFDLDGRLRVQGVGVHQNPFSFYLLMMILLSFARFAVRGQRRYLLLCLVLAAWMALTLTRITMLAAVVGLIGVGVMAGARNFRVVFAAGILGGAVLLSLVPVVLERTLGFVPTPGQLMDLVADPARLYSSMNWQGREMLWPVIAGAWLANPLTGMGLGSTGPLLRGLFPAEMGLVAHNEYLRLTAETGLVGAALYLLAVTYWLVGAAKAGRSPSPVAKELAWPAVGGIMAWAVIAATDNPFDYYGQFTQYIGFCVAGALAAAAFHRTEGDAAENG